MLPTRADSTVAASPTAERPGCALIGEDSYFASRIGSRIARRRTDGSALAETKPGHKLGRNGGIIRQRIYDRGSNGGQLDRPITQLWVAAAKPNQAITLVLSEVPEGWTANVMIGKSSEALLEHFAGLGLKPGEVRKLTK